MSHTALAANFKSTKVFNGLDGLRFFSIMAVIWHHAEIELHFFPASKLGFLGVDLFFVISGFLIVSLLLREKEKIGTISLKQFYMRRALRIFPLYYGFIGAMAIGYYFFHPTSEFGQELIRDLPIYLLYLANFIPVSFGIVWSLASEEQFYLVWPFIEKYLEDYLEPTLAFFLVINQIINFQAEAVANLIGFPELVNAPIMQTTFTPILLGVLLAHLLHTGKGFKYFGSAITSQYASVFWLASLILFCSVVPEDISGLPRLTIHVLMFLLVASVVSTSDNRLLPLLNIRPFVRVGAISYGIYLLHIHALDIANKLLAKASMNHEILVFVLGSLIAIALAELSYRFFETPFLRLKSRFSAVHQAHA